MAEEDTNVGAISPGNTVATASLGEREREVSAGCWPGAPKVSVCMITYNHVQFIAQALDSVLMQVTNFPVEILIHDDASTDGTAQIVKEYEVKYPRVIFPIYQRENQWSKGIRRMIATFLMPRVRGEYVAFLEGDDFWVDPRKLQKQVDFLEANPDCTVCGHPVIVSDLIGVQGLNRIIGSAPGKYSLAEVAYGVFAHTSSLVIRNGTFEEWGTHFAECPVGDVPLLLLALRSGCLGVLPDEMSCYRVHAGGVWSGKTGVGKASVQIGVAQAVVRSGLFPPEAMGGILAETMRNTLACSPEVYQEIQAIWEQQRDWCVLAPEMFRLGCEWRAQYRAGNLRVKSSRSYAVGHFILQPLRVLRYLFALVGRKAFRGRGGHFKDAGKG